MTLPTSYVSAVTADSPWALWDLQQTSGTSMPDIVNGHGGTYNAAPTPVAGPYSSWGAVTLNGGGASIVGVKAQNALLAFEVWGKLGNAGDPQCMWFDYCPPGHANGFEMAAYKVPGNIGPNMALSVQSPSSGWHTTAHPGFYDSTWTHVVLQFESDGHWRTYVTPVSTGVTTIDDIGAYSMNTVTTPTIYLGNAEYGGVPFLGSFAAFAFYDHVLTSTRIRAHFDAASGPPPPPCQYGTRVKPGTPIVEGVSDAVIQAISTRYGLNWIAAFLNLWLGTPIDKPSLCGQMPPTFPTLSTDMLINPGKLPVEGLWALLWPLWCECTPGAVTPTPPPDPTPVQPPGSPPDPVIVVNPTNPCLDLTEVRRILYEILRIVGLDYSVDTFMQRHLAPGAAVRGTTYSGLTGAGTITLGAALGVQIVVTDRPPNRELEGAPDYVWDIGWASVMDGNGFIEERRITRDVEVWMPRLMSDATTFGYFFKTGVSASVTILFPLP